MMTLRQSERVARLLPCGQPRYIRCYDDGGDGDRYTVIFCGRAGGKLGFPYRGMSAHPFHPQGIGFWGGSGATCLDLDDSGFPPAIGRSCHLGRRILFAELPEDCRRLVVQDYKEVWGLDDA